MIVEFIHHFKMFARVTLHKRVIDFCARDLLTSSDTPGPPGDSAHSRLQLVKMNGQQVFRCLGLEVDRSRPPLSIRNVRGFNERKDC